MIYEVPNPRCGDLPTTRNLLVQVEVEFNPVTAAPSGLAIHRCGGRRSCHRCHLPLVIDNHVTGLDGLAMGPAGLGRLLTREWVEHERHASSVSPLVHSVRTSL